MKSIGILFAVLLLSNLAVAFELRAQDQIPSERISRVYGFVGLSEEHRFTSAQVFKPKFGISRYGGGWERLFYKGLGFGLDGGLRPVPDRFDTSFNLHYQFLPAHSNRISPFVTGGFTLAWGFGDGGIGAGEGRYNVGGGANIWLHDQFGPRVEFRHYGSGLDDDLQELRIGGVFRW